MFAVATLDQAMLSIIESGFRPSYAEHYWKQIQYFMPKQHMEHQVPCTDSTVTGPRCGLELTGEQTAFCTHFP